MSNDNSDHDINRSIHSGGVGMVYDMPVDVIIRSFPSELDENKVCNFMDVIKTEEGREAMTPIDVMWVKTERGNYYFAFGGCHRWAAHQRSGKKTIRAKLVPTEPATIKTYLGSSTPPDIMAAAERS
eukprot:gb/GECH01003104.1/.p1 GENE.gb/GECH01003104.1/~~gb/GECH01003104.1/.p1  ORF type:complete len:127 (+),score=24.21 gb/GECH01003104.1/:1-381(+)